MSSGVVALCRPGSSRCINGQKRPFCKRRAGWSAYFKEKGVLKRWITKMKPPPCNPFLLPSSAAYEWAEESLRLRGRAHVSVHTLVFMADNEELPWCHCQPRTQNIMIPTPTTREGWGGYFGGVAFMKNTYLCVHCSFFSSLTGGAAFVCSSAVKTRLHAMMTFVPVCIWCYSRPWQLWWPTFPLPLSLLHVTKRRGMFRKWNFAD